MATRKATPRRSPGDAPGKAAPDDPTGSARGGGRAPAPRPVTPSAHAAPSRGAAPRVRAVGGQAEPLASLQALDRGTWPSSLYLQGPSEPMKAAYLAELRAAWAAQCPESPTARVYRAGENTVEEVLALFQGVSLFSPRDLILVLEVEDWARGDKRIAGLAAGLGHPAGASTLVLIESEGDTVRKALEPVRAACALRVTATTPSRRELTAWGERRVAREGYAADPGAIDALVEACEGDALAYVSELERLMTWCARTRRVTRDDVAALQRPTVGADLPGFLAAVAAGHAGVATQRLGRLLAAGTGEGNVMFALSNLVGGALGGWAKFREPSDALRRRLGPAALARAADAMYRAEAAWKGGRADVVAVLEQATRALSAAR